MSRAISAGRYGALRERQQTHSIEPGEYARVERIDAKENLVCAKKQTGKQVTYDPRRLQGVTLYREADRAFSRGGCVQFTAPNRERHIAIRELGTVENIDTKGNLRLRFDSGSFVSFNIKENPRLDYGYAVTSHSSQGADRKASAGQRGYKAGRRKAREWRLAYVAVSRERYDTQIYSNDKNQLVEGLGRDVSIEPQRMCADAPSPVSGSPRS